MKSLWFASLLLPIIAFAQSAPTGGKPSAGNLLKNGNFSLFSNKDNLWDGVDSSGCLAVWRGAVDVVNEDGGVSGTEMPPSVQAADLNGDGLIDLFVVDPAGYFHIYFNSGTKTEPTFTNCENIPLYLCRIGWLGFDQVHNPRGGIRAALADLGGAGTTDLVLGNWLGEIFVIKNSGTKTNPEYRQPATLDAIRVNTTKNGNLWTNLLAPAVYDWDKDGRPDLLVGDGSYSANAVHLLINKGSAAQFKLTEEGHEFLAYGDGREQLTPAVVDYNGDGNPDLIVGDRRGTLNVYLSEGPWKPKSELKVVKEPIKCGSVKDFTAGICPAVADLNGDGLFDLIIGRASGRISVAYNCGTKTEPKFSDPRELRGIDVLKNGSIREPSTWTIDFGFDRGNINGYYTVVGATDEPESPLPEGSTFALKFGYFPSLNKTVRLSKFMLSGTARPGTKSGNEYVTPGVGWNGIHVWWNPRRAVDASYFADSSVGTLRQVIEEKTIKPETDYKLNFKTRGRGVKKATWTLTMCGWGKKAESKIIRNNRGGVTAQNNAESEELKVDGEFPVGPAWTNVSKSIRFKFDKCKDLNSPEKWKGVGTPEYRALLEIKVILTPEEGEAYIDTVELVPAP